MQRKCPNCNNNSELNGEFYYCRNCGTEFPRYEVAEPVYNKEQNLNFDFSSRVLVFFAAIFFIIIAYFSFLGLFTITEDKLTFTIGTVLMIFWSLSMICLIFLVSPITLYKILQKYSEIDLTIFKHVLGFLIILIVLMFAIGFQLIVQLVYIFEYIVINNNSADAFLNNTAESITLDGLFIELTLNLIILGFGVIMFVYLIYGNYEKPLEYLKIKFEISTFKAIGIGLLVGIGLFVISGVAFGLMSELGYSQDNVLAERLSDLIGKNILYIFIIALFAGLSEEIFFRGFLQRNIGIIPASIIFGIVHIGYLTIAQVIGPLILGLIWGLLLNKTDNLAAPISSHFIINFLSFIALS